MAGLSELKRDAHWIQGRGLWEQGRGTASGPGYLVSGALDDGICW